MTAAPVLGPDDPRADDVRALLARHMAFGHQHSPPEDVHTLDVDRLLGPGMTFCSARVDGTLVAVGALRDLGDGHLELKSMHTASEHRGQGHGRRMLLHLLALARERGATRVSLETGSMDAFVPARTLYAAAGFVPCEPFGDYSPSRNSSFFTLAL